MGFQVSPGVNVTEKDLTTIVPAVATTNAGMAGAFQWGPVGERVLIDSENQLRHIFGDPNDETYNWFFTAANFLGYGNNLQVVRAIGASGSNASTNGQGSGAGGAVVKSRTHFDGGASGAFSTAEFIAKYPGELGNSLIVVAMDDDGRTSGGLATNGTHGVSGAMVMGQRGWTAQNGLSAGGSYLSLLKGDRIIFANGEVVTIEEDVTGVSLDGKPLSQTVRWTPGLQTARSAGATIQFESRYAALFNKKPSTTPDCAAAGGTNDEMNIAIIDRDGKWTGNAGSALEIWEGVSKAKDAKDANGNNIYYKDVLNDRSRYVWARQDIKNGTGGAGANLNLKTQEFGSITELMGGISTGFNKPLSVMRIQGMSGGIDANAYDGSTLSDANLVTAFLEFEDAESVDVSLLMAGAATATVQGILVDICDKRKDCIAFLSPIKSANDPAGYVENKDAHEATLNIKNWRNNTLNKSSSYAVLDSGFKVMLDRYNDTLRHVPLNGDIAGLCARTESDFDAWFSPAGFNRGQIRGVVKLAFDPRQAHRDELYKNEINPVVAFPGEGTVLYGDKTLQSKPSAFDRINVRRLFIVLEKAIATASKFLLFEFNDEFTRAQFRNMVVPFLRTIQSRRGIQDFKVVCDDSNNTSEVIDRNEFVGDIYIKPNRSINYIQLNFIATPTGVDFSEVGG